MTLRERSSEQRQMEIICSINNHSIEVPPCPPVSSTFHCRDGNRLTIFTIDTIDGPVKKYNSIAIARTVLCVIYT